MAADRYMGDRWWVLEGRLDCDRADFSRISARMCRVLSRDGSVRETFCRICKGRQKTRSVLLKRTNMISARQTTQKHTHLLAVLGDDGLHSSHVGGLHHECDSLSLSDFYYSLEHHGVVVA